MNVKRFIIPLLVTFLIVGLGVGFVLGSGSSPFVALSGSASVLDEAGHEYILEETDPLKVTVINDANCQRCDTEALKSSLRRQTGQPLALRTLEASSSEGKELLEHNNASYLPYLIMGKDLTEHPSFAHLTHHYITKTSSGYYLDLVKMGKPVGRYLDVAYFSADDPDAPKIVLEETEYDFGTVPLSEGKVSTSFIIKNEGNNPVVFMNGNTSCGCTSLRISVPGNASPVYMMAGHQKPVQWKGSLDPGEEGKVTIYYDPSVHPNLNKAVTRTATVETNDPNMPQMTFKIHANQVPQ